MILVNMPIPSACMECPLSHWVQSGQWEGMLMCNAIEANKLREETAPDRDITSECLQNEFNENRPTHCPIIGEVSGFIVEGG